MAVCLLWIEANVQGWAPPPRLADVLSVSITAGASVYVPLECILRPIFMRHSPAGILQAC